MWYTKNLPGSDPLATVTDWLLDSRPKPLTAQTKTTILSMRQSLVGYCCLLCDITKDHAEAICQLDKYLEQFEHV